MSKKAETKKALEKMLSAFDPGPAKFDQLLPEQQAAILAARAALNPQA